LPQTLNNILYAFIHKTEKIVNKAVILSEAGGEKIRVGGGRRAT